MPVPSLRRPSRTRLLAIAVIVTATVALTWKLLVPRDLAVENLDSTSNRQIENPFLKPDAEDPGWPFVRGPSFDGHSAETHLAESWPENGPPVLWTRKLGQGYSSFVAWRDRIATQFQTLSGQYVVCLEADTGRTLWKYRYAWAHDPAGVYPGPRATPTYANGRIYFAAPDGLLGCLDAESGKRLWSVNLKRKFNGKGTEFGSSCSPTVIAGKVVMPVGGFGASLVAVDAENGSIVWKSGDDPASYTPAYPIVFRGQKLVLGYLQNALVCHDLETGQQLWRRELSHGYDEHAAWPIYSEPYLWISGPFRGGSELLRLTGDDKQPLKTVWKSRRMSNDIFSTVLVEGELYGFDIRDQQAKLHRPTRGQFRCIDFLTGKEHWATGDAKYRRRRSSRSKPDDKTRIGHASVIAADGKLVLFNDMGELILAKAAKQKYEELGRVQVLSGELCWTRPSLHRGRLFVRNHSRAACIYLGEARLLEPDVTTATLTVDQIPQSEYFDLAGTILGVEPEYAFDVPTAQWLQDWFAISLLGVLGMSLLGASATALFLPHGWRIRSGRWLFWTMAFILAAIGTTVLSRWRQDFIFTWPVCIFVTFQAVVYQMRTGNEKSSGFSWWPRIVGLSFLASCIGYFLICRRLSLVFEWVFLCGFPAALPFAIAGATCFRQRRWRIVWELLMTAAAFAAFYWSAVGILILKANS